MPVGFLDAMTQDKSWSDLLEGWLSLCSEAGTVEEQSEALRFLVGKLTDAPPSVIAFLHRLPDSERIEAMLALNAIDSAVATVIEDAVFGYMLSSDMSHRVLFTMVLPGTAGEINFEARTEAMAKLGGVTCAMLRLAGQPRQSQQSRLSGLH